MAWKMKQAHISLYAMYFTLSSVFMILVNKYIASMQQKEENPLRISVYMILGIQNSVTLFMLYVHTAYAHTRLCSSDPKPMPSS